MEGFYAIGSWAFAFVETVFEVLEQL